MPRPIIVIGPQGAGKTSFLRYLTLNKTFAPDQNGEANTERNIEGGIEILFDGGVREQVVAFDTPGLKIDASQFKEDFFKILNSLQEPEIQAIIIVLKFDARFWTIVRDYVKFCNHTFTKVARERIYFAITNCKKVENKQHYLAELAKYAPNLRYFLGWNENSIEIFDFVDPSHIFSSYDDYDRQIQLYREENENNEIRETTRRFMIQHERVFDWFIAVRNSSQPINIKETQLGAFGGWYWWMTSY